LEIVDKARILVRRCLRELGGIFEPGYTVLDRAGVGMKLRSFLPHRRPDSGPSTLEMQHEENRLIRSFCQSRFYGASRVEV
jgi:hypothetical protein